MVRIPEIAQALCRRTPLLWAPPLGCFLKLESMQRTGSVKLRGAAVKLGRMSPMDRSAGVITASAGNHGLAMSCAGQRLGVAVRVVMPDTAPRCKREGISSFGGEIVRHGHTYDDAEKMGRRLAALRDSLFVSSFDDSDVIDGNGAWLGREIVEQCPKLKRVIVPIGGGGTAAGLAAELCPEGIEVIGVSPMVHCAMAESCQLGRALTEYTGQRTICEELEGGVGWRSYRTVKRYIENILLVREEEVIDAVVYSYRKLGLIIEPSAAVVVAAARDGKLALDDTSVLVITGGNIDSDVLHRWLGGPQRF
jgi:threonine dehydratase